jgi:VWFA-related protein
MTHLFQRCSLLCIALLVITISGKASDKEVPQNQPPTFISHSELVQVPVVVTDGNGHVKGLTKDDFVLQENGKDKAIATFEEVKATPGAVRRTQGAFGEYSNTYAGATAPKSLTIFALDLINTPFYDQTYARQQLIKFLATRLDANEPTALILINRSGIKVLHDFTTDTSILIAALQKTLGEVPAIQLAAQDVGPEQASIEAFVNNGAGVDPYLEMVQREAIMVTLESFQHVAESFAGVPGRKSLIWATAAFPFGLDPKSGTIISPTFVSQGAIQSAGTGMNRNGGLPELPSSNQINSTEDLRSLEPLYQRTFQMLSSSNICVYPVDARGLIVYFPGADVSQIRGWNRVNQALFEASRETMVTFADVTGGRAFYNRNDLAGAFGKAATDSTQYYMLGYYLDKNAKPGWHRLHVKVKTKGVDVQARSGFFVSAEGRNKEDKKMDIRMALASPLDYTAVPMTVLWSSKPQIDGAKKKVAYRIILPPEADLIDDRDNNHVSLEVFSVARTPTGVDADQFGQHLETNIKPGDLERVRKDGITFNNAVEVPPGEYTVRFIVRDNLTGRIGSVSAPLRVSP